MDETIAIRHIVEACMDFASAVSTKARHSLSYTYDSAMRIGRLGLFLQALRHDAKGMSEYSEPVIFEKQLSATAGLYGLSMIDIASLHLENGQPILESIDEGKYLISIRTLEEMISCCYGLWTSAEQRGLLDKPSLLLVELLYKLRIPRKKDILYGLFEDKSEVQEIIGHLIELGLLTESGDYYLNPELFKGQDVSTLDTLSEFNILPDRYLDSVDLVSKIPGLPVEALDERIRSAMHHLGRVGILVPIEVEVPGSSPRAFVFADPENLSNSNLSYETAAYFRFNEVYAIPQFGRLTELPLFMKKLLNKGLAGEATNIQRNYVPLQMKGVFNIIKAETSGYPVMVLRKRGVVEDAATLLSRKSEIMISWKTSPVWVSDPAATRAAHADDMEKSLVDLKDWFKDNW